MKTDVLSNVHPFRVHHSKERYLLLPDFDHRIIECGHILLPLFNSLLFGEIFHAAKVKNWFSSRKDTYAISILPTSTDLFTKNH